MVGQNVTPMQLAEFEINWNEIMPKLNLGQETLRVVHKYDSHSTAYMNTKTIRTLGYSNFLHKLAQPDTLHLMALHKMAELQNDENSNAPEIIPYLDTVEQCGIVPPESFIRLTNAIHENCGWIDGRLVYGIEQMQGIVEMLENHQNHGQQLIEAKELLIPLVTAGVGLDLRGNHYYYIFPYAHKSSPTKRTNFSASAKVENVLDILKSYLKLAADDPHHEVDLLRTFSPKGATLALLDAHLFMSFIDGSIIADDFADTVGDMIYELVKDGFADKKDRRMLIEYILQVEEYILEASQDKNMYVQVESFSGDLSKKFWKHMHGKET